MRPLRAGALVVALISGAFYTVDYVWLSLWGRSFCGPTDGRPQCYFSDSYWEARARFLAEASAAAAEVTSVEVVDGGYFMDFAVLKGTGDDVVLHVSGVHGVEGFSGSAIQTAYLRQRRLEKDPSTNSTVVLVHAFNPFGMAHFRRWDQDNVDLNRNGLTEDQWSSVSQRDPNVAGYENFDRFFNPPTKPSLTHAYPQLLFQVPYYLLRYGFDTLKQSIVAGQYHKPEGIFYGGSKLQPSYLILRDFLRKVGVFSEQSRGLVTLVDVHTGLGSPGVDTLMFASDAEMEESRKWFSGRVLESQGSISQDASHENSRGYHLTVGLLHQWIPRTMHPSRRAGFMGMGQEFGTLPGALVARALTLENMAWHYHRDSQPFWASYVLAAFDVRTDVWRKRVLARGLEVINMATQRH